MVTRGEQQLWSSVDDMLGALVYDNIEGVQQLLDQKVTELSTRRVLKRLLEGLI